MTYCNDLHLTLVVVDRCSTYVGWWATQRIYILKLGYVSRFWTSSLFNRSTSLRIGRWSSVVDVFKTTLLTSPSESGFVEVIRTIGDTFLGVFSCLSKTISLTAMFLFVLVHFLRRCWSDCKYSLFQRDKKRFAWYWTRRQRRRAYRSVRWKIPGGGKIMLVFMVSKSLGDIGLKSFGSLDGKVRVSWIDNSFYFT